MSMKTERINVLLVEDEQTLSMIIKETLEEGSLFSIHIAENGEKGLRRFFEEKPDIVVADVMMPRMDGFEMVQRIRQTPPSSRRW